jgi:hypothetical protein
MIGNNYYNKLKIKKNEYVLEKKKKKNSSIAIYKLKTSLLFNTTKYLVNWEKVHMG